MFYSEKNFLKIIQNYVASILQIPKGPMAQKKIRTINEKLFQQGKQSPKDCFVNHM